MPFLVLGKLLDRALLYALPNFHHVEWPSLVLGDAVVRPARLYGELVAIAADHNRHATYKTRPREMLLQLLQNRGYLGFELGGHLTPDLNSHSPKPTPYCQDQFRRCVQK